MRLAVLLAVLVPCASAQTPDEIASAAFDATLDTPGYAYRFDLSVELADTTMTSHGHVTTRADTTAHVALFRIEMDDQAVAFDGTSYRLRSPRTHKVYVDTTQSGMEQGIASALRFHPTIGTALLSLHNEALVLTDEGDEDTDGAPCRRLAYSATDIDSLASFVSVCYDAATHLPSNILVRTVGLGTPPDMWVDIVFSDTRAIAAPPDSIFSLLADGYTEAPYTSDEPLLALGARAPSFMLTTSDSATIQLDDYDGRPVLLDFWGTWCGPCVEALPEMAALQRDYPDLVVLGLAAYEEDGTDPAAFARARGATYPVARVSEEILDLYHVRAFPTYYLLGPDGSVRFSTVHDTNPEASADLRTAVGVMLGAPR